MMMIMACDKNGLIKTECPREPLYQGDSTGNLYKMFCGQRKPNKFASENHIYRELWMGNTSSSNIQS